MIYSTEIAFATSGNTDVVDLSAQLRDRVEQSGVTTGTASLFAVGSTGALTTIEYEPALVQDLKDFIERLIPSGKGYRHDATWGDANGHSHLRASLFGPSLVVPVSGGRLVLGTWQQVVFMDFDVRPRDRKVQVVIQGE